MATYRIKTSVRRKGHDYRPGSDIDFEAKDDDEEVKRMIPDKIKETESLLNRQYGGPAIEVVALKLMKGVMIPGWQEIKI